MLKILNRRIPREFRKNVWRYVSLFLMIMLGMYLIISIVGAADIVSINVERYSRQNQVEDGEFALYVPLEEEAETYLEEHKVVLEEIFYMDFTAPEDSTLRIFKNREQINQIQLDEGRLAETAQEIVLEKHYAAAHEYAVGDVVQIASLEFTMTGVGSTADYDAVYKNMTDIGIDSKAFGTAFVSEQGYTSLAGRSAQQKAEEYLYAYRNQGTLSDDEIKNYLTELPFSADDITDTYLTQEIEKAEAKKTEIKEGIQKLLDGAGTVKDGTKALAEGSQNVTTGIQSVQSGSEALASGSTQLAQGAGELNSGIGSLAEGSAALAQGSTQLNQSLAAAVTGTTGLLGGMDSLQSAMQQLQTGGTDLLAWSATLDEPYKSLLMQYISGVQAAAQGTSALHSATSELAAGTAALAAGGSSLADGSTQLNSGVDTLSQGAGSLYTGSQTLYDGIAELQEQSDALLDEIETYDADNLTMFIKAADNPRIAASVSDIEINKQVGIMAGIIFMILFTYVISVFVVHTIDHESEVIGAFYAMGATKKVLIRHYLMLPVLISLAGGLAGTVLGFSPLGVDTQMVDSTEYFSLGQMTHEYPVYLLLYGICVPPLVALVVNYLTIRRRLSKTALVLLRNEKKVSRMRNVNLKHFKFINQFRIRHFLASTKTSLTVMIGMYLSLLLLFLGLNSQVMISNIGVLNERDTKFSYMYTLKYPTEEVPQGGEEAMVKSFSKEAYGYTMDVTLLGIYEDNPYFDFSLAEGKNQIVLSDAAATKFKLKAGDKLIVSDEINEIDYAFHIAAVVPYSAGLYAFMDIEDMRSLFGQEEDYYNTVFSDTTLSIDAGRIYAVTAKSDITGYAQVFKDLMLAMLIVVLGVAVLIFVVVMYLMLKMMIDQSAFSISMFKMFGYQNHEIRKLYLDGNLVTILLSALVCIPLAKVTMDAMYPYMIANVAVGGDTSFTPLYYVGVFAGILLTYLLLNFLLVRRVRKVSPTEVLKQRE
ncbi:MAG: FtsX-like permease family protein [Lachnospiraceae bacterium]